MRVQFNQIGIAAVASLLAMSMPSLALANSVTLLASGGAITDGTGSGSSVTSFDYNTIATPQTIQSVQAVTLNGLTHAYSSDLRASLFFVPNDINVPVTEAILFDGLNDGAFFISNNFNGTYSFSNTASNTVQTAAQPDDDAADISSGTYLPSDYYLEGVNPAPIVNLSSTFAGIDLSSGVFQVVFEDFVEGDAGSLVSASLELTTAVPEPASLAAMGLAGTALVRRRK